MAAAMESANREEAWARTDGMKRDGTGSCLTTDSHASP